jgi:hypothetical protein
VFVEDFGPFFDGYFGETGVLDGTPVSGLFDAAYGDAFDVEGNRPRFTLRSSQVPPAVNGKTFVLDETGVSYTVAHPEPSGNGVTILHLRNPVLP